MIKTIIFDLYGTLVAIQERKFMKHFYRQHLMRLREGKKVADIKRLTSAIRDELMTIDLSTSPIPVDFINALSSKSNADQALVKDIENELRAVLAEEAKTTRLLPGVIEILHFFKRRSFLIGVVSNVSTYHKAPFFDLGLDKLVDEAVFSCDVGYAKPQKEIYLEACKRLNAKPDEAIFVGDSYKIDIRVPVSLGMKAIHISKTSKHEIRVNTISEIGLVVLENEHLLEAKSCVERAINIRYDNWILKGIELQIHSLGKYNLIYKCSFLHDQQEEIFFLKRHLNPSSTFVDYMAQEIARLTNLQETSPMVVDVGDEPFLLTQIVRGIRYHKGIELTDSLLYQIGKYGAFSYIFANIDFHPRNAFVEQRGSADILRMIDYENCFFDYGYELGNEIDPYDPELVEKYVENHREVMTVKETMSFRTLRRFLFNFVDTRDITKKQFLVLCSGIADYYKTALHHQDQILEILYGRQSQKPFLIVGMHRCRRALTRADIDRIRSRMDYSNVAYLIDIISP